ncbi:MAG TPA: hypothetical protein VEZ16_08950 [Microvirga sp.]|nr:hypothetical protein [Microvirga sp.]
MSSILKLNPTRPLRYARTGLAALTLGLALVPAPAPAQEAPARPQPRTEAAAADATKARMVVVEWRIKKGREAEFLEYWSTRSTIPDRSGLIGEFLNRVEDRGQYPWMVWEFDPRWTTFINVGFWREGADFQEQIGRFIDNSRPPMDFEADRRRRVFMAPERWRIGETPFPAADHPAVR